MQRISIPGASVALSLLLLASPAMAGDALIELGRQVFSQQAQPSCAICHTLSDAGAGGAIGPDLDQLRPDAKQVEAAVTNGVGIMPAFAGTLTTEQIEAVAKYVSSLAGN